MPLKKGASDTTLRLNIEQLLKDGYPRGQALAIALAIQKRAMRAKQQNDSYNSIENLDIESLKKNLESTPVIEGSKRYIMGNIKDIAPSGKHLIYHTTDMENKELVEDAKFWNEFMDILDTFPDETHIENEGDQIIIVSNPRESIEYQIKNWISSKSDPSTPAPKKDRIKGSDRNKPGSAKSPGGDIKIDDATEAALKNKMTEHNKKMTESSKPDWSKTTVGQLKAVYRRGAGAYSTSHRPGVSRAAWAMARVNAYLYLLKNGSPKNKKYTTDNDLLPEQHPKSTRKNN